MEPNNVYVSRSVAFLGFPLKTGPLMCFLSRIATEKKNRLCVCVCKKLNCNRLELALCGLSPDSSFILCSRRILGLIINR